VTFSPDGVLVYITTADGSLRVLYASSGEERWSYSPGIGSKGWPITCKSGVSFGMDDAGEFAVYAIIDEAPDGDDSESESRIIAVSHPSNQMLWISVPLAGEVAGTPFVTQSPDTVGSYIYTTHNTVKGPTPEGLFSVMAAGDGAILLTESASSTGVANIYTYGPPGGSHFPSRGMYTGGENNTNDIVVWVTSDDNGLGREAFLRAFQLPMGFDPAMLDEMLVTSQLANVAWSAVTSPTMSEDGTSLFVTARRSRVHAWVNDTLFDGQESWTADLVRDSGRPSLRKFQ
jgi:outer membrane protein assembly factor BamB